MRRLYSLLAIAFFSASVLSGCGDSTPSVGKGPDTPPGGKDGGRTSQGRGAEGRGGEATEGQRR